MKFEKPSPGLIAEFKAAIVGLPGRHGKMFGYDALYVNGNLAAALWQNTCVFKLSERDAGVFLAIEGARPFSPMKGRAMTGWYEAPEDIAHDPEELAVWLRNAVDFVATLPPKAMRGAARARAPKKRVAPGRTRG